MALLEWKIVLKRRGQLNEKCCTLIRSSFSSCSPRAQPGHSIYHSTARKKQSLKPCRCYHIRDFGPMHCSLRIPLVRLKSGPCPVHSCGAPTPADLFKHHKPVPFYLYDRWCVDRVTILVEGKGAVYRVRILKISQSISDGIRTAIRQRIGHRFE